MNGVEVLSPCPPGETDLSSKQGSNHSLFAFPYRNEPNYGLTAASSVQRLGGISMGKRAFADGEENSQFRDCLPRPSVSHSARSRSMTLASRVTAHSRSKVKSNLPCKSEVATADSSGIGEGVGQPG